MILEWSIIMFVMSLFILGTDLVWQMYWAGTIGPERSRQKVIASFKDEETAREIKAALDIPDRDDMKVLKKGYGYVATCSHSIGNNIPYENFITYINAIHKYGKY